jgi:hypothetical protein
VLRHFAVTQCLRARTDAVAVEYDAGQLGGRAPRRDEDPARRETDLILAVLDDDVPRACDPSMSRVACDLVLASSPLASAPTVSSFRCSIRSPEGRGPVTPRSL